MTINKSYRKLFLGGGTAAGILIFLAIVVAIQYIVTGASEEVGSHSGG